MATESDLIGFVKRTIETGEYIARGKTTESGIPLWNRTPFIKLQGLVNRFIEGDKEQRIVILPGLRGVGKTTLLFQIFLWLQDKKQIPPERLLYVSLDYLTRSIGSEIDDFFESYERNFLEERIERNQKPLFIFLDEAHYSEKWEIFVKSLYDRNKDVFIFVSGSSAIALNTSTDITRRQIIEEIIPLTFREYLQFKHGFFPPAGTAQKIRIALNSPFEEMEHIFRNTHKGLLNSFTKKKIDVEKELEEYLYVGGFPGSTRTQEREQIFSWVDSVLNKIITNDIPRYSQLSSQKSSAIMATLRYFAESIPVSPQSANSIASLFSSSEISVPTARNILKSLTDSCILCKLEPNGSHSIRITKKPPIYYFSTPSLRYSLLWAVGKFDRFNLNYRGIALEEATFNILLKSKIRCPEISDIKYDYEKGGSDFVLKTPIGNLALEVGWGKKDNRQVLNTIKNAKCRGGLVIHNTNQVTRKENILSIPRELLLFS